MARKRVRGDPDLFGEAAPVLGRARPARVAPEMWRAVERAREVLNASGEGLAGTYYGPELALLALLGLGPDGDWASATAELLTVTEVMTRVGDRYADVLREVHRVASGRWAANTRETVRKDYLQPYVERGLYEANPDDPTRPVNSEDNSYRVTRGLLELCRTVGSEEWARSRGRVAEVAEAERRRAREEAARHAIRVDLGEQGVVVLSPGGQNPLIAKLLSDFRGHFFPGSTVVYVGDARDKTKFFFGRALLAGWDVELPDAGKIPDVVLYDAGRHWLVLAEAVVNGGEIDAVRYAQLRRLFDRGHANRPRLVFVNGVETAAELRALLPRAAWETELWSADEPGHLIHKDGLHFVSAV